MIKNGVFTNIKIISFSLVRIAIYFKIYLVLSLLFNQAVYGVEYTPLKNCIDLDIDHIPQLSLKNKQARQYSALLKLLTSEQSVEKDNKEILNNFYTCWLLATESIKLESLKIELTDSGVTFNDKIIKFGQNASLSRNIAKTIRAAKIKQQSIKSLVWYCFTEAAIATTNNRFNYYIYADSKQSYDAHYRGRRHQLGFMPEFKGGDIIVERIIDPELSSAGIETGMLIKNIRSNTLKVEKNRDWWFQDRAFNYTLTGIGSEKEVLVQGSSKIQIKESITTLRENEIAYIQFHYFNDRTDIDVWRFLRGLDDTIKGLVLDVRGNSGGRLNLKLVSFFLKSDKLVAVIDEHDGTRNPINADMAYVDQPIVILQDENSASMSELLSAMLQKQGRAIVVGQTSFGKAAIQHVFPVLNEGQLALVKEKLYYPDLETSWADVGIQPDIKIEVNEQQELDFINSIPSNDFKQRLKMDRSLSKAIEILTMERRDEN